MKTSMKLLLITSISALPVAGIAAQANGTATVEVRNTFDLTRDTEISFGVIRATADTSGGQAISSLILPADGSASSTTTADATNTSITVIEAGTPGTFTVSRAAPFSNLTITFPGDMTLTTPAGGPNFSIAQADWTAYITAGNVANVSYTTTIQVDANGTATFNVGTTLVTDATLAANAADYSEGTYSGAYQIQVNY